MSVSVYDFSGFGCIQEVAEYCKRFVSPSPELPMTATHWCTKGRIQVPGQLKPEFINMAIMPGSLELNPKVGGMRDW